MPNSGKPGEASSAELEERSSGKPETSPLAKPEDRKSRGNPELSRRERRRVRELRKLRDRSPVRQKEQGLETRGSLETGRLGNLRLEPEA
jgi:hypothetical protein